MSLEQKPFIRYNEEKKVDSFTVRLNKEEREQLEKDKIILEQKKDSTAIKQLARIGSIVIHGSQTSQVLEVVFKNKRKNKRIGIYDFE